MKTIPIIIISTLLFTAYPTCEGSVTDSLCSSIAGLLNDEAAKADTAVKDCKEKCDWTKKKQKLIATAQKKANNSCAKGI
ncbi:MAG: hypothetical protein HY746_04720, partial [Elusimicrobia bacterium]|nr:hypothetical protein [Elusimicrobiota bacterium]